LWAVFNDPPDHTRVRAALNQGFTNRRIRQLREFVAEVTETLLRPLGSRRSCELVRDFAYPLPALVIAKLLGVPDGDVDRFKTWSDDLGEFITTGTDPGRYATASSALEEMGAYFSAMVRDRRRHPADDLLTPLVDALDAGVMESEDELVANCILLLFAGHETTTNLLANAMYHLASHPDQLQRLAEDPLLYSTAVEEILRFDNPAHCLTRIARRSTEIGGVPIEAGERIFAFVTAANRDPAVFVDPDRLDVGRDSNRHLSFGLGIHFCLGAPLARLEAMVALPRLVDTLGSVRVVEEARLEAAARAAFDRSAASRIRAGAGRRNGGVVLSPVAQKLIGAMHARKAAGQGISGQTDVERLRAEYREMGARSRRPDCVEIVPAEGPSCPASWIRPDSTRTGTMLYLHGGGYVIGGLESHTAMAAHIAQATGCDVLLLDYRLAPEHRFPAAVDDATEAYRWLLDRGIDPATVVVAGDSAGGGLTMATLLRLRAEGVPRPAAAVLISPWADLELTEGPAREQADSDPMVDEVTLRWMRDLYLGEHDRADPLATPLHGELDDLPPVLIHVGEHEILLSDSRRLAESLERAGGEVELLEWPGMFHVWHFFAGAMPEADAAVDALGRWVRQRLERASSRSSTDV
jgi:cytochrome P450/acetyl esterase/lipase